jgi:hypothetical protein
VPAQADDEVRDAIVRQLTTSAARAAFVAELRLPALGAAAADRKTALDRSLDALERDGRVLVRAHSSGDPHMKLLDLRVVSLVEADDGTGRDQINEAVQRDQALWDEWITEFLRHHRCAG